MIEQPYFRPMTGSDPWSQHDIIEASRVAVDEEMARNAALGRPRLPKPEPPSIKAPILSQDFAQRLAALDKEIFKRGLAVDRERLLSLGHERFKQLLELDRKARSWQKIADFTRFGSVQDGLQAFEAATVPERKTAEQLSGDGKERDEVRKIAGWQDLWKCTTERQERIDDIYSFHDLFESLMLGHSMLESLGKDGRARSRFFCDGKRRESGYLADWLSVVDGSLSRVTFSQPIWSIVAWLADETAEPPTTVSLAQELFNVRVPAGKQLQLAQAVLDAFLLDYDGWHLWQFFGRATRTVREVSQLSAWRARLAKRFRKITQFHSEVRSAFYSPHGYGGDYHHKFEPAQHRAFLGRLTQSLLDRAAAVCALAMEVSCPVLARFEAQLLCEGKPPEKRAEINAQLAAAFPGSNYQLEISEIQP